MPPHPLQKVLDDIGRGRLSQARAAAQRLYAKDPANAQLNAVMASIASKESNWPQVCHYGERAVAAGMSDPQLHNSLGVAYLATGKVETAIAEFEKCLLLDQYQLTARLNLHILLTKLNRLERLEQSAAEAVRLFPANSDVAMDLATALYGRLRHDEAVAVLRKAIFAQPTHERAVSFLASVLNYSPSATRAQVRDAAMTLGRVLSLRSPTLPPKTDWAVGAGRPLRIGFLSSDLREHSVSRFLLPTVESLDRRKYELWFYNLGVISDAFTQRFRAVASGWRDCRDVDDAPLAAQIRTDRIDVLFELNGNTAEHRLTVCEARVAPVQITYIGSPSTTGLSNMDYRIVDAITDPPDSDGSCVERLIRIEPPFLCFEPDPSTPPVGPLPCLREGSITFGTFNVTPKLNARILGIWARILRAVPRSRLLIKNNSLHEPEVRRTFMELWAAAGGDAASVETMPQTRSTADHLRCYERVDIALDPFPYHGTTTTCEALYMGVPVVTLAGELHVSRVSASLLSSVGLSDLIAQSEEDYVRIARDLAADTGRLNGLRQGLRARCQTGLCDKAAHARKIEQAIDQAWLEWCQKNNRPGSPGG